MQKISPLRASLEAFNKFKAKRSSDSAKVHSNPFGITFKGTVLQMDVFDNSTKTDRFGAIKEKISNVSKLTASAWVSTINKFSQMKNSAISFGGKIKQGAIDFTNKLNNTKVELNFDFITHNVSNLQRQPIAKLEEMFKSELSAIGV